MEKTERLKRAKIAALWEAHTLVAQELYAASDLTTDPGLRHRLLVLSNHCQSHASRYIARLSALGGRLIPVLPDVREVSDHRVAMVRAAHDTRTLALANEELLDIARMDRDMSTAWVAELNRSESMDVAEELANLTRTDSCT